MKNIIIIYFLFSISMLTGQTNKGNWMVGGAVSIHPYNSSYYNKFIINFHINPGAGYFIANNFLIGTFLEFNFSTYHGNSYAFNPFLRYYLFNLGDSAKFFSQLKGGIMLTKNTYPFDNRFSGDSGAGIGLSLFLNQHIALEGILGFDYVFQQPFSNISETSFKIGFQYFLWSNE